MKSPELIEFHNKCKKLNLNHRRAVFYFKGEAKLSRKRVAEMVIFAVKYNPERIEMALGYAKHMMSYPDCLGWTDESVMEYNKNYEEKKTRPTDKI